MEGKHDVKFGDRGESPAITRFLDDASHENFASVMDEHMGVVRGLALRIVLNEHDADDVAQETFISAYRNIDGFRKNAKFATWLCRIAVNKSYSLLRSKKHPLKNTSEMVLEPTAPSEFNPHRGIESSEALVEIHKAIAELPEHLRTTLILVTIDETPIDEAVYILECNKATLYWRLHKARKLLAKTLKPSTEA